MRAHCRRSGRSGDFTLAVGDQGTRLRLPTGPFALPVVAQAKNDDTGACWESVFTEADVRKNDETAFLAR